MGRGPGETMIEGGPGPRGSLIALELRSSCVGDGGQFPRRLRSALVLRELARFDCEGRTSSSIGQRNRRADCGEIRREYVMITSLIDDGWSSARRYAGQHGAQSSGHGQTLHLHSAIRQPAASSAQLRHLC